MSDVTRIVSIMSCVAILSVAARATEAQEGPLTLADAAAAALAADPSLAAVEARADVAEADRRGADAQRWPTLQLEGTAVRFQEPMVVAPLHSLDPASPPRFDDSLLQGAARLRYTAFDGGRRGADVRAAGEAVAGARAREVEHRMETLERVTAAYLSVLSARAHRDAAERRVAALEAEEGRARQAVEAGSAARVELLRASAALQEAYAGRASARSRTEVAERTLARLLGAQPDALTGRVLVDVAAGEPGEELQDPTVPHPALEQARARERAAAHRLDGERAGRLPSLRLDAALLDYGTWDGGHVAEWQAGVAVSWPLFTGGARTAGIRRAEAELAAAREDTEAARRGLAMEVDRARSTVAEADARAEALRASVSQWVEVARIEALAMETGAGVQSDLLAAEASLFRARAGWAEARYDRILARVRLARALGLLDEAWLETILEVEP